MERVDVHQPTFHLESVKTQAYEITNIALQGAESLGMDRDDIDALISSIQPNHFYKSMSTKNKNLWQDVYRVPYNNKVIYLKISTGLSHPFCIVQLKEK